MSVIAAEKVCVAENLDPGVNEKLMSGSMYTIYANVTYKQLDPQTKEFNVQMLCFLRTQKPENITISEGIAVDVGETLVTGTYNISVADPAETYSAWQIKMKPALAWYFSTVEIVDMDFQGIPNDDMRAVSKGLLTA